jgi:hypothetical protein
VQSRRTPHIPQLYLAPTNLPTNQFVCVSAGIYFLNTIQTRVVPQAAHFITATLKPLCTPHSPLSLPPSPPLAPPCGNPVASMVPLQWCAAGWPLGRPILLPPVAREEAAGVEVVNIRLRHINVPVNAAACIFVEASTTRRHHEFSRRWRDAATVACARKVVYSSQI